MAHFSNAELAQQINDLIAFWAAFNEEYANWLGGTVAGGPSSDGLYPLTDYTGAESLVACPALLADNVSGYVGLAAASETAAAASAAAALASETAAAASASTATTQAGLADAARILAEAAESGAVNSEVNAATSETNAAASEAAAATSETNAATSETNAGLAEVNAEAWANTAEDVLVSNPPGDGATEYSALHWAAKAATFNPALYVLNSEIDLDLKTLTLPANTAITAAAATVLDDASVAAMRTTLGVDAAGTDNSTDVTLAGQDYLSLSGQQITANKLNIDDLADGTDGELITWSAAGVAAAVAVGTATHVLTSNGAGAAPTFQAPAGGGGDPYTYDTLASDHTNSTTTPTTIVSFTPAANTVYYVEWRCIISTETSNVMPHVSLNWNSGNNEGGGSSNWSVVDTGTTTGGTAGFYEHNLYDGTDKTHDFTSGMVGNRVHPWWGWVIIDVGASPSGDFELQLDSENATFTVTAHTGSFLRYLEL